MIFAHAFDFPLVSSLRRFVPAGGSGADDDDLEQLEGDYVDHLQQPNNTKKRKVPIGSLFGNGGFADGARLEMAASLNDDDAQGSQIQGFSGGQLGGGSLGGEVIIKAIPVYTNSQGRATGAANSNDPNATNEGRVRKFHTSSATLTGLKRKEILKSRKRQILAVLASVSSPDAMALDQALSAPLAWYRSASVGSRFKRRPATKSSSHPPRLASAPYIYSRSYRESLHLKRSANPHPQTDEASVGQLPPSFLDPRYDSSFNFECYSSGELLPCLDWFSSAPDVSISRDFSFSIAAGRDSSGDPFLHMVILIIVVLSFMLALGLYS